MIQHLVSDKDAINSQSNLCFALPWLNYFFFHTKKS